VKSHDARTEVDALVVRLAGEERDEMQRRMTVRAGVVRRARIVRLCADGPSLTDVGRQVGGLTPDYSLPDGRSLKKASTSNKPFVG
jgi:hypothetical protein